MNRVFQCLYKSDSNNLANHGMIYFPQRLDHSGRCYVMGTLKSKVIQKTNRVTKFSGYFHSREPENPENGKKIPGNPRDFSGLSKMIKIFFCRFLVKEFHILGHRVCKFSGYFHSREPENPENGKKIPGNPTYRGIPR